MKTLISILSVGFALMLAAIITLAVLFGEKSSELDKTKSEMAKSEVCTTKACIDAASMILTNIDVTKNPCK